MFLIILFPFKIVFADEHSLESIHIHTFIHEDGSATITEIRKAYLTEGTENYIVIENLGKSEITNFIVEENGITYEFVENWNMDASQAEKAFKNGIIKTEKGYELCWGIGEYGAHEYVVQYKVTNFIKQLDDAQILFWRYINDQTNIPPKRVRIEIEADRPLTSETEKIWGFGFEGEIHFLDERIVAYNSKPFDSHNYATILVRFPNDSFVTDDILNQSFDEIYERAMEESDYKEDSDLIVIIVIIVIIIIAIGPFTTILLIRKLLDKMKKASERRKIMSETKGLYNRDLPYQHQFLDLFYLLKRFDLSEERFIYTALFLKWIYNENVSFQTREKKGIFRTKQIATLKLNKPIEDSKREKRLYNLLSSIAGKHHTLSPSHIYLANAADKKRILRWEEHILHHSRKYLVKQGYLEKSKKQGLFSERDHYEITKKGKELIKEVVKFTQYLNDFSLVHERESFDVKVWDQILIWAAALGLADVVLQQFKELYPDYVLESKYPIDSLPLLHSYSAFVHSTGASITRSSGGGGFTSSGGGGGSFGGGSGGGTR